ncbi:MAG: TolC family protein [Bacteroidales bacterium]|nr:TolC family protein [Bacteroidales bacterium]
MKKYIFLFISVLFLYQAQAQDKILSLDDVIKIAQEQSPDAMNSRHQLRRSYWEFRYYKATQLPSLSFEGVIPSINRAYKSVTNYEDGLERYVGQSYVSYEGNLKLNQAVSWTGGNVFMQSGLQQVVNYTDSSTINSFLSTPINIGFNQPLFQYNKYKWDKRISPLKYEISKNVYLETIEQVSITAINYYFNLLAAQVEYRIARINVSNFDTLYRVAQGRYNLGRIGENEVLQMELSQLTSQSALEKNALELEDAIFKLKSFLRLKGEFSIQLLIPKATFFDEIDREKALQLALENSSVLKEFDKRLLEAQAGVNEAKTANGLNANLYAVYGLTKSASQFNDAYRDPRDQQQLMLGLQVPILDWGQRKGQVKMAQSQEELVKTSVEQERIDFNASIVYKVADFNMQKNQLLIAGKSDTIAQKSYKVTKNRYLIGKIGVTDLNIAQKDTDRAKIGYIKALQTYWVNYYNIRKSTLYDFQESKELDVDYQAIYGN